IGATVGTLAAQAVINHYTELKQFGDDILTVGDWQTCWFIFAGLNKRKWQSSLSSQCCWV
ncbi:hypothetical protein CLI70_12175, partial [Prevotella intermedia]